MVNEVVQPGVAADDNGLVLWVPTIADPSKPTVAELTAGTVKKITYGLTPDGFSHDTTENEITTGRYTLANELSLAGTVKDNVELKYVYAGTDDDVNRLTLENGAEGFLVHRLGYPNATEVAADQLVDVIPSKMGVQRRVPPAANTELAIAQKAYVTGKVQRFVPVVA